MKYLKLLFRLWPFLASPTYRAAQDAVGHVARDAPLQQLGQSEGKVSYCPRCGQRPDHDVRHDEAFEIVCNHLEKKATDRDIHFAVELAVWLGRRR